ncbi:SMP-30/gluconolactonase/LRE family protein [Hydromonas duriensis]|uniref:Sugar lactone lactonase YvrE n=1 Tax=Hydromonas duriensis TaxID=1527608 RepID=A0A4R6YAX2_9BURK|nr:SMP-30/gluconolactonase/LRE family protein [Hydromonas duriensis]TDR32751.1 sugar lactone lactonase YvrE [Hydromonas duriensis]
MTFTSIYGQAPETRSGLAESPVWDDHALCWYWIDIPKRLIHRHDLNHAHTVWQLPQNEAHDPGALCIAEDGQLMLALRAGLALFDTAAPQGLIEPKIFIEAPYDTSTMRFNDGGVDAQGRFWLGTLFSPKTHAGASLFCLDKGRLHAVLGEHANDAPYTDWGVTTSNGWAMSLDGSHMFHADTQAHAVYRYDVNPEAPITHALSNRTVFYHTPNQQASSEAGIAYQGRPDGAAVDREGMYWNAQFEGGHILKFSPSGDILERIALPARCPTMLCFGGEDLKTILITTTGNRPEAELAEYPSNGLILTMRSEIAGLPTRRYQFR